MATDLSTSMNGVHDTESPTETTALLVGRVSVHGLLPPLSPAIEPVVLHLLAKGIHSCSSDDFCPHSLPTRAETTAFSLIVLLELRARYLIQRGGISSDIWGQWTKEQQNVASAREVDRHILSVWSQFLEEDLSAQEIEDALWHAFPFTAAEETSSLRVVDLLSRHSVPQDLLTHRIIFLSFLRVWKHGRSDGNGQTSVLTRFLYHFDRMCTPRVMHTVDFIFRLLYLATLAHFVLLPPLKVAESVNLPLPDMREGFLVLYSAASTARQFSLSATPFILTLLAFLSCLPTVPFPENIAYSVLLFSFSWHALELHLPIHTSPVLPLAVLIWHGISRVFLPVVAFFLPALLLSLFLLSTSLSDMTSLNPAPMETRVAFLTLFSITFLLLLSSLVMLVLVYPSLSANPVPLSPWDRYSTAFMRTVVAYSSPYVFPPPFNLIPGLVLSSLGQKEQLERLHTLEGILWRIVVKRRKTTTQTADEDLPTPQSQAQAPSATALSTRVLPLAHIPLLSTICIRVFAENLQNLSANPTNWENVRLWLKALPDTLITKVFGALRFICPTVLNHGFIVAHFLRGQSIGLSSSMPGVKRITITAIADSRMSTNLLELELSGFAKESDTTFASVVSRLPSLRVLNLRRPKTVEAAAKHCKHLTVLNLKYTAVDLEVLKVAGIPNWVCGIFSLCPRNPDTWRKGFPTEESTQAQFRQSALSDSALNSFLMVCPNLKRLDLSLRTRTIPKYMLGRATLEKLSLTAAISNSSAMTMTDQNLRDLTDVLASFPKLERLGLTGRGDGALAYFIRRVGRKCKRTYCVLTGTPLGPQMAGIPSLRSSDLVGLLPDEEDRTLSPLQILNLNNTAIDDDATPYISSCPALQTLSLAGTKVTNAGLYPVIDACVHLAELDLTSCRGVGVVDRRRFFEVWEKEWTDG
ncbi:RNI-like protein [Amylocystis lapponica]|nr:RNI-like protein [Amylocystis lapponica]